MTKLEQRLNELDEQLEPLNLEREAVRHQILTERSQFKVGDTIAWRSYGKEQLLYVGRVIKIREWCCKEPMWIVRRIRKDGTEGGEATVRPYNKPTKFT